MLLLYVLFRFGRWLSKPIDPDLRFNKTQQITRLLMVYKI
jgi:hypothetical protein